MRAAIPTAKADYPTKLVRMIEPFGSGSGPEVVATAVGRKLAELWGQPVTVENHPGAGSTAAAAMVATSPADGYTLLVHTNAHAYSAALSRTFPTTLLRTSFRSRPSPLSPTCSSRARPQAWLPSAR